MNQNPAIMICGHGSRDQAAVNEFNSLARHIRERLPEHEIESGFLEFATPVIRTGLAKLVDKGAQHIVCLPGMLFAAGHVKNDLPSEINSFSLEYPGIEISYGRELAIDIRLLEACKKRIVEAERKAQKQRKLGRKDTLLMVVGRGTSDPDANSNISKIGRMLWEGMGFGWGEVSFSGVAYPLVDQGLHRSSLLGFKRIIVFPYFLFTGILVRRIYSWTDKLSKEYPEIQFVKAGYLNAQEHVIDTFVERYQETLTGENNMNCQLCKYREKIIGYEGDQGAPQAGHHHHVRGIGTDGLDAHDHGIHHGHHHFHDTDDGGADEGI
ncbi:MAG: sirohydrochlorin chelatase [Magnetovibrio sp.]|nr:sirohydrochlorin chelatase [Magnetovibrio sp.]